MFRKITKNWFGIFLLLAAFASVSATKVSAVCPTGSNLIVNGDAEGDPGAVGDGSDIDVSGWNPETGEFTVVKYGASGFPSATDPGPANRGNFLFDGGRTSSLSGSQTIDVSSCATQIDVGNLGYNLSGFLGGYLDQDDNAQLTVTFRNAANTSLGTATIGPVLSADRGANTGLLSRNTNGTIPVGTRSIDVLLQMTRTFGTDNDGYADNLSFMLTAPTAAAVSIGGRVTTASGRGIANVRLSLTDSNGNVRTAVSTSFGYYRFDDVQAGETYILSVRAKHFTFPTQTQVLSVNEDEAEVNFTAYQSGKGF